MLDQYAAIVREPWELGAYIDKPRAWRLPMSCVRRHGPGWVAIGDAAGFINPMNGEGIDYGLESGILAVEQFLANPATAPAEYDRLVGERFDSFLRTGRRFSFLIGHPWLLPGCASPSVSTDATPTSPWRSWATSSTAPPPAWSGQVLAVADERCASPTRSSARPATA